MKCKEQLLAKVLQFDSERYKGSLDRGITYGGREELRVEGYSDCDWTGDKESRKTTSGFIFMMNGWPVSWCSKRQSTVELSSPEADYIRSMLHATRWWSRSIDGDPIHGWLRSLADSVTHLIAFSRAMECIIHGYNQPPVKLKGRSIPSHLPRIAHGLADVVQMLQSESHTWSSILYSTVVGNNE